MVNSILSNIKGSPKPTVGMGATMLYASDRSPCTIIKVSKLGKSVVVIYDDYKGVDGKVEIIPASKEKIEEAIKNDRGLEYTLRKNGRWILKGSDMNSQSTALLIGYRDYYYDLSF